MMQEAQKALSKRKSMKFYPHTLAIVFTLFFIFLGVSPIDRSVWIVEVTPVVIVFLGLVLTYTRFQFSNLSYTLMAFWLFWHTVGAHYTFANVPFDFITDFFDFQRNHFDRIGHLSVGFFAYPATEYLLRQKLANIYVSLLFSLFFIMSIACAYEIVEWAYAVIDGGNTGVEFLGTQGDIWDAQKDMLSDTLGAIFALILYSFIRPDKKTHF